MRSAARFRVKLNGKRMFSRVIDALIRAVVGVDKANHTTASFNLFIKDSITVVLRGNVCSARFQVFYRLVYTSVAVF